jgi:hypothetical protein
MNITKGTWKVKTTSETDHQTLFVYSEGMGAICMIPDRFKAIKEHEANARLIASAPDLLENLERLLDRLNECDMSENFPSAVRRAEDAIHKAKNG